MRDVQRLVILAPNWLGDAVMALPLINDIRRAWPNSSITVAGRGSVATLFGMVPAVNETVTVAGGGGLSALTTWRHNAEVLSRGAFDAALLLPNSFASAWMVSRARIPERWGYRTDWRGRFLTRAVPVPATHGHHAEYYQTLGAQLGFAPGPRYAAIDVGEGDRGSARKTLSDAGLPDEARFVVMAAGAAYGRAKQWLPKRFAELSAMLARERQMHTVLVGSHGDARVCAEILRLSERERGPVDHIVNVCGRTDVPTLAGVLSIADAVVANDSGAMHLAAAVGARVIAVFGATDERRTAPLPASAHAPAPVVVANNVWCRPCLLRECPIDHRCMSRVSARQVCESI